MKILFVVAFVNSYMLKDYSEEVMHPSAEQGGSILTFERKDEFIQLSKAESEDNTRDLYGNGFIAYLLICNFLGCALCFLSLQFVNMISKKLTLRTLELRYHYEQFKSLAKFKNLQREYDAI